MVEKWARQRYRCRGEKDKRWLYGGTQRKIGARVDKTWAKSGTQREIGEIG